MNKNIVNNALLLLTALIWGFAFVAQSMGMEHIRPFTFCAIRFFIGGVVLLPVIFLTDKGKKGRAEDDKTPPPAGRKTLFVGGINCGVILCGASLLQQAGLTYTGTGRAGFLTALYLIIVPFLGAFTGRRVGLRVWLCAAASLIGMYLLCMGTSAPFNRGDALILLCAVLFSFHIVVIDRFSPRVNGIKMSCIQFFTASGLSAAGMLFFESPDTASIAAAALPLLYTGVLSSGVAYTLQVVAQRNTPPASAAIIMSFESVFAALGGWLILGQGLSIRELVGCGILFLSIVLVQLPGRRKAPQAPPAE